MSQFNIHDMKNYLNEKEIFTFSILSNFITVSYDNINFNDINNIFNNK